MIDSISIEPRSEYPEESEQHAQLRKLCEGELICHVSAGMSRFGYDYLDAALALAFVHLDADSHNDDMGELWGWAVAQILDNNYDELAQVLVFHGQARVIIRTDEVWVGDECFDVVTDFDTNTIGDGYTEEAFTIAPSGLVTFGVNTLKVYGWEDWSEVAQAWAEKTSDPYNVYVAACEEENLEPLDWHMWEVHGKPAGPI